VVADAGGKFPGTEAALLELPGVGPYTAAAIAAIAFDERTAPVDGNIERVVSRLFAIGSDGTEAGWRASKVVISARAQEMFDALGPKHHAGDLAQGLMDLGATVCTPRRPACAICPLTEMCAARKSGEPERWPVKAEKKAVPTRFGAAYVVTRGDEVLLERRGPSGLLGGMLMPLSSDWMEAKVDALASAPAGLEWEHVGEVRHVFTHFALRLQVWRAEAPKRAKLKGEWLLQDEALKALPTVGRKAVKLALGS
jgi:A/G-specific adenine glycosylase